MGINAAASYPPLEPSRGNSALGLGAQDDAVACEVRVIACSDAVRQQLPLHARARQEAGPDAGRTQAEPRFALHRSMQGASFGLSTGERAIAKGAGILFVLVTLAAILL